MMKAICLLGKNNIKLMEVPIPEIGDNEALLKVRAASICGTDIRMYKNGYKNVSEENPLILGHEFAGDIVKVGKNVTALKVGQKVGIAPNIGCGTCDLCVSGQTHLCDTYDGFGINMDGGFAEYVRIPEKAIIQGNIAPLDDTISYSEAAMVEPLSCVYNGQELLGIRPGDDVLIIGMGPIGIMHIMVANMLGAGKIFINDLSVARMEKAKELFPDIYIVSGDIKEALSSHGVNGVDICIIAAPSAEAQAQSLEYMNMNGRLLFFGGLPDHKKIVPLDMNILHYKQLRIQGCTKQSVYSYRLCAKFVDDKRIPLEMIMSDTYGIDDYEEAFQKAADAQGLKHVIVF